MNANQSRMSNKITNITDAWTLYSQGSKFGQMTLEEFKTHTEASLAIRMELASLRLQIKGMIAARTAADLLSRPVVERAVAGVVADPDFGSNSALYRAMNYVTKSERASGLTRKTPATDAASNSPSSPAAN